jgi:hypothetical protein
MTSGTSSAIFVPRDSKSFTVRPGEGYFTVRLHGIQVLFQGRIWESAKNCLVTTKVDLHHSIIEGAITSLQQTVAISNNKPIQLGLNVNLIDLVPAVMPKITISIDLLVDRKNQLSLLANLINTDAFLSTISLAPGHALIAKTLSGLTQKLVENVIPKEDQFPALQFTGDFNISTEGLQSGYYVILSGMGKNQSLPNSYDELSIQNRRLLIDDIENLDLSYVILEVACTPSRTREVNGGALWNERLRQAEDLSREVGRDPLAKNSDLKFAWKKCVSLLSEASTLMRNDPNYLLWEAEYIKDSIYEKCKNNLRMTSDHSIRHGGDVSNKSEPIAEIDTNADRELLNIPIDNQELQGRLDQYAEHVFHAREILRDYDLM